MKEIRIHEVLVKKRKARGLTQDALAEEMGVTKASVSKWETGQSYPDIMLLPRLATFFNISIDELMGYTPQMDAAGIRRSYEYFSKKFAKEEFTVVYEEVKDFIKKYYACFPCLVQMMVLLINHHMLAKEESLKKEVLGEIITIARHIKEESQDLWLTKQANSFEATAQMLLGEPLEVLELLDGTLLPIGGDEVLLASAHQMRGEIDEAIHVLQVSLYQHVMNYLSMGASYLQLVAADEEAFGEGVKRFFPVAKAMNLLKLHPNIEGQLTFSAAHGYMVQGKKEEALGMLKRYVKACEEINFPYKLQGDTFFKTLEPWLENLDLGTMAPRDEKVIKEGMIMAVKNHPLFQSLQEEPDFLHVLRRLEKL